MVRGSIKVLKDAASGLHKALFEILVCPLSKQPLRFCEETNSLISDAIGVSYPVSSCSNFYAAMSFYFFTSVKCHIHVWMFCGHVKMNQDPGFLAENFSNLC